MDRADFRRQSHTRVDDNAGAAPQRVKHWTNGPIGQVYIKYRAVWRVAFNEVERLGYRGRRTHRYGAGIFNSHHQIEGDKRLVLDHKNAQTPERIQKVGWG